MGIKVTVIGGGSSYTPELVEGFGLLALLGQVLAAFQKFPLILKEFAVGDAQFAFDLLGGDLFGFGHGFRGGAGVFL